MSLWRRSVVFLDNNVPIRRAAVGVDIYRRYCTAGARTRVQRSSGDLSIPTSDLGGLAGMYP